MEKNVVGEKEVGRLAWKQQIATRRKKAHLQPTAQFVWRTERWRNSGTSIRLGKPFRLSLLPLPHFQNMTCICQASITKADDGWIAASVHSRERERVVWERAIKRVLAEGKAIFECEWMSASSPSGILAHLSRQGQMLVIDRVSARIDTARIVCCDAAGASFDMLASGLNDGTMWFARKWMIASPCLDVL